MTFWGVLLVAGLLSLERLTYLWVWHRPRSFEALCTGLPFSSWEAPVEVLQRLFWFFKALQGTVFLVWCWQWGDGSLWPAGDSRKVLFAGFVVLALGQLLNLAVFYRLGKVGVFYGNRFGHRVPWCERFPFSVLRHPQYVGTVLSIWGFFLIMRFPKQDWFLLPALETIYYATGSYLER